MGYTYVMGFGFSSVTMELLGSRTLEADRSSRVRRVPSASMVPDGVRTDCVIVRVQLLEQTARGSRAPRTATTVAS